MFPGCASHADKEQLRSIYVRVLLEPGYPLGGIVGLGELFDFAQVTRVDNVEEAGEDEGDLSRPGSDP